MSKAQKLVFGLELLALQFPLTKPLAVAASEESDSLVELRVQKVLILLVDPEIFES